MKITIPILAVVILAFAGAVRAQSTRPADADPHIDQIIERANDHFQKGKLYLNDNKRKQARVEFDKAIDEILISGIDVRSSRRLETAYLILVESIYREEVPIRQLQDASDQTAKLQVGFREQPLASSRSEPLAQPYELLQTEPQSSYDRFRDVTLVWIPYDDLYVSSHHDLRISAFVTYRGKDLTKPEKMGISFESTPHEYSYLAHSELYVLADGERVPLGRPSARDTKSDFKYVHTVTEWLEYWITLPMMKKIAHSQKVEMRLDSFEFNLRPGFLRSMEKLIAGIPNPKPTSTSTKRPRSD